MESSFASEPIMAYLRRKLDENRGDWPAISRTSEVPYWTITRIAQNENYNCEVASAQKLIDYFAAQTNEAS